MVDFPAKLGKLFRAFAQDEGGATAIEYALIAAGIFLAITAAMANVASSTNTMFNLISTSVINAFS